MKQPNGGLAFVKVCRAGWRANLITAVALVLVSFPAAAGPPATVHFRASTPNHPLKAGAKFAVLVEATIEPGWHLYTLAEPEDGPAATAISLAEEDPAQFLSASQSRPRTTQDPVFSRPVSLFEGKAIFTLHLQLAPAVPAGLHILHILIRFQSCNDHVCLPPHTETVEASLTAQ